MSFGPTEVCGAFATGQRAIFAAGSGTAVVGEIVLAVPFTASPLQSTAAAAPKIVVLEQGGSALVDTAAQAQAAGAVGVIIVSTAAGSASTMPAAGKIVVIEQGGSALADTAAQAQAAGAVGMIIVSSAAGGAGTMTAQGNFTDVRILVVVVAQSAAALLQASQGTRATIRATGAPGGQSTEAWAWLVSGWLLVVVVRG